MRKIALYLIATFSLTYLSHGLLAILTTFNIIKFESLLGFILFFIGGSSPTIFAIIFMFSSTSSKPKERFKMQLFSVRYRWYYWVFALVVPLLLGGVFQVFYILLRSHTFDSSVPFFTYFIVIFTSILFGGLEEIGWRGFLQAELMKGKNLIVISFIIGIIWGFWHIPLFFIEEVSHYSFEFIPFLLGAIMFSTYLTWLYAKTRSLLLVILFHASINASATIGLRLVFEHTVLAYILIMVFTLVGIGLLYRHTKFLHNETI